MAGMYIAHVRDCNAHECLGTSSENFRRLFSFKKSQSGCKRIKKCKARIAQLPAKAIKNMREENVALVIDRDGLRGAIDLSSSALRSGATEIPVHLADGTDVLVPATVLQRQHDGSFFLPASFVEYSRERAATMTAGAAATGTTNQTGTATESTVIPVIVEELRVDKRVVETGRVRIKKFVREHEETVDEPLMAEEVRVERVAVNRIIDAPVDIRHEDGRMIIPLMEEVMVVEKRLMLKEELHVTRQQVERRNPQVVTLRSEEVEVERAEGERTQEGGSERSQ